MTKMHVSTTGMNKRGGATNAVSRASAAEHALRELDRIHELTETEMSTVVGGYGDFWEGPPKFKRVSRNNLLPKIESA